VGDLSARADKSKPEKAQNEQMWGKACTPCKFRLGPSKKAAGSPHLFNRDHENPFLGEFAALFRSIRGAFLDHERAKSELKTLIPR
jgi:hypothetical protein